MKHRIVIRCEGRSLRDFALKQQISKCITAALAHQGVNTPCEINVLVTDDEGIRAINNAYRKIDKATDVLSFPMFELTAGQLPASWEAYKSLSLSSLKGVINIPLNGILFIPDFKSEFLEEVVCVEEKDGLQATAKETLITNDIWDGESLLDESLFTGDYATKHMLLLRNKFFKSCGFKTGLQKWFRDKGISLEDLKKRGFITFATDINQIVMVTTPNSMKFLKFMQGGFTENNVRKWVDKVDCTFGVVKYDKRTKFFGGKMVQSSYQFINTLGLTEAQAEELLKPSKDYLTTIRNDYDFMRYHFSDVSKREKIKDDETEYEEISDGLAERSEVIFTLMKINNGFKDTLIYNNIVTHFCLRFKMFFLTEQICNHTVILNFCVIACFISLNVI